MVYGGTGFANCEHPSIWFFSPLKAASISSSGLYNAVVSTENLIADRLTQLGESNNVSKVAKAVVKKLSGVELSVNEIEALSKSSYGQEVLNTIVPKVEDTNAPVTENLLQGDADSGIINNNQETGVDIDGSTNPELLAGREVPAVSGSGNGIRQQSENSRALSDRLGSFSGPSGDSSKSVQAGSEGWLVRRGQTSEIWSRLKEGFHRKLSGIKLKDTDSSGRKLSKSVQNKLADTVLKNEDGTIISIFHYTQNEFDEFEYGDIGFHGGTLQASFDRQDQNAELGKPHIFKEMYARVTNPLFFESDGGVWDAEAVASRAKTAGVITQEEYDYLKKLEGFDYGKYSDEASVETRRILKEKGYDGIVYINEHEDKGSLSVIVFDADQFLTVAENGVLKENSGVTEADPEGPADFMPEGENSSLNEGSDESGKLGLTEPTDQEIYRDPTDEENTEAIFGKRKNAKQRHILDVAKKLDSGMKVVYVNKDSKVLNGKNGKFNYDTNTMYIAENLSTVEMYAEVFKHEFVHRLELRKAYDSFKKYLFNKSEAFGDYAKARLHLNDEVSGKGDVERTREQAIDELIDMYVENVNKDSTLSREYKQNFTREKAEREAVADFVARTLFKGNTEDLRLSLKSDKGKDFIKLTAMPTNLALFEEMARTDRNLLQKIIDAIKDLIAKIKGVPNLEKDLRYIEERLTRVYASADNKKIRSTLDNEVFDVAVLENGNTYVKASRKIITGTTLKEQRTQITNFFKKLLKNKPSIDIRTIEGDVLTLTMEDTADKARDNYKMVNGIPVQMSKDEFRVKLNVEAHIDEIAETSIKSNEPLTKDRKNHDFAKDGFEYRTAYFEDFDGKYYKIRFSIGHNGQVATVYNVGKIKEDVPSSAKLIAVVGSQALDGPSSTDIISNKNENVKQKQSDESYSSDNLDINYLKEVDAEEMKSAIDSEIRDIKAIDPRMQISYNWEYDKKLISRIIDRWQNNKNLKNPIHQILDELSSKVTNEENLRNLLSEYLFSFEIAYDSTMFDPDGESLKTFKIDTGSLWDKYNSRIEANKQHKPDKIDSVEPDITNGVFFEKRKLSPKTVVTDTNGKTNADEVEKLKNKITSLELELKTKKYVPSGADDLTVVQNKLLDRYEKGEITREEYQSSIKKYFDDAIAEVQDIEWEKQRELINRNVLNKKRIKRQNEQLAKSRAEARQEERTKLEDRDSKQKNIEYIRKTISSIDKMLRAAIKFFNKLIHKNNLL